MYSIFRQDSFKRTSDGLNTGYVFKKEKKIKNKMNQRNAVCNNQKEKRSRGSVALSWTSGNTKLPTTWHLKLYKRRTLVKIYFTFYSGV